GEDLLAHIAILAALALVALATTPWAMAAALRQAGEKKRTSQGPTQGRNGRPAFPRQPGTLPPLQPARAAGPDIRHRAGLRGWPLPRAAPVATRLPAGRDGAHHVRARAVGLAVDGGLCPARRARRFAPGLAPSAGRADGARCRPCRRLFCAGVPRHRLAVGPADGGGPPGGGSEPHLDAAAVLPLSRPHRLEPRLRRSGSRRSRRRHLGAGWRHQPADHQVLGRLVEHPAPAGLDHAARRAGHSSRDPDAAALDGGLLPAAVHPAGAGAHRDRDRSPPARDRGPERMSSYSVFILSAYLVVLVVLGGLTIASLSARSKVRRELAARGLDRPREQRARTT